MKKILFLNRDYTILDIDELAFILDQNDYETIDYSNIKIDEYIKIILDNYNAKFSLESLEENESYLGYIYDNFWDFINYFINLIRFSKIIFKQSKYSFQNKYFYNDILINIYSMGADSIIVIAVLSIAFGASLGYQILLQLRSFGAEIFSVNILLFSLFKGLGLFIALVILAAKFGSGLIAKTGFMKITEEWNALKLMNIDPEIFLLKSKIIAFIFLVPFCSYLSIFFGIIGGYLVFYRSLNANIKLIISLSNLDVRIFFAPLIKGVLIGLLLGIVLSYEAYNVEQSSDKILIALSRGVVLSIIICLLLEVLLSIGLGL